MMGLFSNRKKKEKHLESYLRPKWSHWRLHDNQDDAKGDIELDVDRLAKEGFLTPDTFASNLARDYNLVKRRLFQRIEYFGRGAGSKAGFQLPQDDRPCPVVLVTSGSPGEGKTFSSCNLAMSLAFDERLKVLLIDTDLAKPSVPGVFGYEEDAPGLFEQLKDPSGPIERFILKVTDASIKILPAGQATTAPTQMLAGQGMIDLIDGLASRTDLYDLIIMDGPPLLATTEAATLAPLADEVVIVVGSGDTTVTDVGMSLDFLGGEDHVSLLMNRIYFQEQKTQNYYGYGMNL